MRAPRSLALAALLLALAATLTAGCGKKAWPEPVASEDRFHFAEPRAALAGGCLTVEVDMVGAIRNLEELILEIGPADCPGCPLRPDRVLRFTDRAEFMSDADTVQVRACGLAPGTALRWRLRGVNGLSRMAAQATKDQLTEPAATDTP